MAGEHSIFLFGFAAGVVVSGALRFFIRRTAAPLVVPIALYIAFSVVNEFVLPYRGGGASFWPLDILFIGPPILLGSWLGVFLVGKLRPQ